MRFTRTRNPLAALALSLPLALAACSAPVPEPDGEPQATAAAAAPPSALRATMEEPLDKARAVEDRQADAEAERAQVLAETGD
jgi:hypothetical protein